MAGYEVQQTGYALKNTLVIDIPVKKLWTDSGNAAGIRPASVDIALYANGTEAARVRLTPQGGQLLTSGAGEAEETAAPSLWQRLVRGMTRQNDAWSYTFTGLPQYDANGSFITYTVEEVALPDGYGEVIYGGNAGAGFTVKNVALGGLRVEKKVEGAQGDKSRAFHFTVTLSDTSVNGTYGGMTFHNGVAGFALKHGESDSKIARPGRTAVGDGEAAEPRLPLRILGKSEGGVIGGAVVHNDHFKIPEGLSAEAVKRPDEQLPSIVGRDHDRYFDLQVVQAFPLKMLQSARKIPPKPGGKWFPANRKENALHSSPGAHAGKTPRRRPDMDTPIIPKIHSGIKKKPNETAFP